MTVFCVPTPKGLRLYIRARFGRNGFAPNCDLAFRAAQSGTVIEMRTSLPALTIAFFACYFGSILPFGCAIVASVRNPGHSTGSPLAAAAMTFHMFLFAVVILVAGIKLRGASDVETLTALVTRAAEATPE